MFLQPIDGKFYKHSPSLSAKKLSYKLISFFVRKLLVEITCIRCGIIASKLNNNHHFQQFDFILTRCSVRDVLLREPYVKRGDNLALQKNVVLSSHIALFRFEDVVVPFQVLVEVSGVFWNDL